MHHGKWRSALGSVAAFVKALAYLGNDYAETGFTKASSRLNSPLAVFSIAKLVSEPQFDSQNHLLRLSLIYISEQ